MRSILKSLVPATLLVLSVTGSAAASCASAGLTCSISSSAWTHINARHCKTCDTLMPPNSELAAGYCGGSAQAVSFCQAVISASNCTAVTLPGGRIAASATLSGTAGKLRNGCGTTSRASVIFEADKRTVVTEFPGDP